jgi:hypothetical protein
LVLEKVYYIIYIAYYLVDFFYTHTTTEPGVFKIHHVVTLSMVVSAIVLNSPAVGPSLMLLHEVVDVPLYTGKIFVYLGLELQQSIALCVFAISCTWFRIINYPIICYHCACIALSGPDKPVLYMITAGTMWVLYALHLIWEYKIIRNALKGLRGIAIHDDRSD